MKKIRFRKLDLIEWAVVATIGALLSLIALIAIVADGTEQPSIFETAGKAAHSVVKDFKKGYDQADSAANKQQQHGR